MCRAPRGAAFSCRRDSSTEGLPAAKRRRRGPEKLSAVRHSRHQRHRLGHGDGPDVGAGRTTDGDHLERQVSGGRSGSLRLRLAARAALPGEQPHVAAPDARFGTGACGLLRQPADAHRHHHERQPPALLLSLQPHRHARRDAQPAPHVPLPERQPIHAFRSLEQPPLDGVLRRQMQSGGDRFLAQSAPQTRLCAQQQTEAPRRIEPGQSAAALLLRQPADRAERQGVQVAPAPGCLRQPTDEARPLRLSCPAKPAALQQRHRRA